MSIAAIGVDITSVTTAAGFAVGTHTSIEDQTTGSGTREYRYVAFPASAALVIGDLVLISAAGNAVQSTAALAAQGQAAGRTVGVVVATVASSTSVQYGWVQIYGIGAVKALTLCALNTLLYTGGATVGAVDDTSAANVLISGIVLNSTVGGGTAVTPCTLNYPFLAG
jgi:hypothetical protein